MPSVRKHPFDERRGGEGEDDGEADIAEIEQRRMDREAEVLQHGIEVAPLERRRLETRERIRRQEDEGEEGARDQALHRKDIGAQDRRQAAAEDDDERSKDAEDQHPEQHRAFVIAPDAGDLVDRRRGAVRILRDIEHRKIRRQMRVDERARCKRDSRELPERARRADRGETLVAAQRTPERQRRLQEREREREGERVMADLDDHGLASAPCAPSCQRPSFFKASTTSRGM